MTQEEKQLLLIDLCARLPYGVKVQVYDNRYAPTTLTQIDVKKKECVFNFNVPVENCLPYLRPMSSMTEEERSEYENMCDSFRGEEFHELIDWLNKKMLDYRGLIQMSLALPATEDMYNIK